MQRNIITKILYVLFYLFIIIIIIEICIRFCLVGEKDGRKGYGREIGERISKEWIG